MHQETRCWPLPRAAVFGTFLSFTEQLHANSSPTPPNPIPCPGIRRRGLWAVISHQPSCTGLLSYQGLVKDFCPVQTRRDVTGSLQLGGRPSPEPAHAGTPICNLQKAPPFDSEPVGVWHFPVAVRAGRDSPGLTGLARFGSCTGAVVVTQPRDRPERFILTCICCPTCPP